MPKTRTSAAGSPTGSPRTCPPALRGAGGPGREHEAFAERLAWNRRLAAAGWTCLGWPAEHGGRDASLGPAGDLLRGVRAQPGTRPGRGGGRGAARADADRVRHAGAEAAVPAADRGRRGAVVPGLLRAGRRAPTWRRWPPPRCRDGDEWVITGQKVWTSLAHVADWCFVLAGPTPGSRRSAGLSYLLVPMRQPGVTVRPIRQLTGDVGVQRGLLRRGAHARSATWSARRATAGGSRRRRCEFERGVAACSGSRSGYRRELGDLVERSRGGPRRRPTRGCASGSPGPGSASRSCGRTRSTPWGSRPAPGPRRRC